MKSKTEFQILKAFPLGISCINFVEWRKAKLAKFVPSVLFQAGSLASQMQKPVITSESWQELGFLDMNMERLIWKDLTGKHKRLLLTWGIFCSVCSRLKSSSMKHLAKKEVRNLKPLIKMKYFLLFVLVVYKHSLLDNIENVFSQRIFDFQLLNMIHPNWNEKQREMRKKHIFQPCLHCVWKEKYFLEIFHTFVFSLKLLMVKKCWQWKKW